MAFVRQPHQGLVAAGGVHRGLAGPPQRQHMAPLHAIALAAVDRHDLVLASAQPVAVQAHDAALNRVGRGARYIGHEFLLRHRRQAVADHGFQPRAGDAEGCGHQHRAAGFGSARGLGRADVAALVAQHLGGQRVAQRHQLAEETEVARASQVTAHIGGFTARNHHAAFLCGHDAWRGLQLVGVEDHGLGQEGADQVERDRRDGAVVQQFAAHPRRQAHGVGGRATVAAGQAQTGPAVDLFQHQHLARVDQVRVADLLQVHAPEFRPAPGALQEQAGDAPQRVARLHGVRIGRVGGQLRQRHAGLRHALGGVAPLGCDGQAAGLGNGSAQAADQAAGRGSQGGQAQQGAAALRGVHAHHAGGLRTAGSAMRKCRVAVTGSLPSPLVRPAGLGRRATMLIWFHRFCP